MIATCVWEEFPRISSLDSCMCSSTGLCTMVPVAVAVPILLCPCFRNESGKLPIFSGRGLGPLIGASKRSTPRRPDGGEHANRFSVIMMYHARMQGRHVGACNFVRSCASQRGPRGLRPWEARKGCYNLALLKGSLLNWTVAMVRTEVRLFVFVEIFLQQESKDGLG